MDINRELEKAKIQLQKNNPHGALKHIDKIVAKYPMHPVALKNQAILYLNLNKINLAEGVLEKLTRLNFDLNVYQNLVIVKYDLEKFDDCKIYIDELLKKYKENFIGKLYKAKIFRVEKNYQMGIKIYEELLEANQNDELVLLNYGFLLNESGDFKKALSLYEKAETLNTKNLAIIYNKGVTLMNLQDDDNAELCFKKCILMNPNKIDPYINLSSIYFRESKLNLSKDVIQAGLKYHPKNVKALFQLALNYSYENKLEKSEELYKEVLEYDKNYIKAHYSLSLNLLRQKKFDEFKNHYAWRVHDPDNIKSFNNLFDDFQVKTIDNHELILFYYEQGIGDQIFFSRFLKKLKNKMVLVSSKKTIKIFSENLTDIKVINKDEYENSLSTYKNYKKLNLASVIRFLDSDSLRESKNTIYKWPKKTTQHINIAKDKMKIGISWKSRQDKFGQSKGYPLESLIKSMKNEIGIEYINLQYGNNEEELERVSKNYGINIYTEKNLDITNNISDLASLINDCDVVVTCSNVTAHVAGVFGKKTILILPKYYGRLWFWDEDERGRSYWYESIKIIINENNDWKTIFNEVQRELKQS
jgi:tetratricopeptide (TPR) repeat protein